MLKILQLKARLKSKFYPGIILMGHERDTLVVVSGIIVNHRLSTDSIEWLWSR